MTADSLIGLCPPRPSRPTSTACPFFRGSLTTSWAPYSEMSRTATAMLRPSPKWPLWQVALVLPLGGCRRLRRRLRRAVPGWIMVHPSLQHRPGEGGGQMNHRLPTPEAGSEDSEDQVPRPFAAEDQAQVLGVGLGGESAEAVADAGLGGAPDQVVAVEVVD